MLIAQSLHFKGKERQDTDTRKEWMAEEWTWQWLREAKDALGYTFNSPELLHLQAAGEHCLSSSLPGTCTKTYIPSSQWLSFIEFCLSVGLWYKGWWGGGGPEYLLSPIRAQRECLARIYLALFSPWEKPLSEYEYIFWPGLCCFPLPQTAISQSQLLPPPRVSNRPPTLSQSPALPVKTQTAKQNQSLLNFCVWKGPVSFLRTLTTWSELIQYHLTHTCRQGSNWTWGRVSCIFHTFSPKTS